MVNPPLPLLQERSKSFVDVGCRSGEFGQKGSARKLPALRYPDGLGIDEFANADCSQFAAVA